MSILHDEPAVDYDEAFSGGVTPRPFANSHEPLPCQTPTASDPAPGRFALDEEDEAMSLASERDAEAARLVSEYPDLTYVRVMYESADTWIEGKRFESSVEWRVHVARATGRGRSGTGPTPKEAGDAAVAALNEAASSVPAVAETVGAA